MSLYENVKKKTVLKTFENEQMHALPMKILTQRIYENADIQQ